jgi:hypothetical protein
MWTPASWHCDDAKMPSEPTPDMPDLSLRELKVEMDGRFQELKMDMDGRFRELKTEMNGRFHELTTEMDGRFDAVDRRFDRLEAHITEGEATTRRHFDIVAESLRAEIRLSSKAPTRASTTTNAGFERWRSDGDRFL